MPTTQLSNAELTERYGAAWNEGDLDAIMELQGEDIVFHLHIAGFEEASGPDAVRAQFAYFFDCWPGMHFATQASLLDGDLFVHRFRFRAELRKPFALRGEVVEPTGRPIEIDGTDVITLRDGLVRSKHTYMDSLAMRELLRP